MFSLSVLLFSFFTGLFWEVMEVVMEEVMRLYRGCWLSWFWCCCCCFFSCFFCCCFCCSFSCWFCCLWVRFFSPFWLPGSTLLLCCLGGFQIPWQDWWMGRLFLRSWCYCCCWRCCCCMVDFSLHIPLVSLCASLTLWIQPWPMHLVPPGNFRRHSIPRLCLPIRDNYYHSPRCVFWFEWQCSSYLRSFPILAGIHAEIKSLLGERDCTCCGSQNA